MMRIAKDNRAVGRRDRPSAAAARRRWRRLMPGVAALMLVGAAAGSRTVEPFNGTDLDGWKLKPHRKNTSHWTVGEPQLDPQDPRRLIVAPGGSALVNAEGHGVDIFSAYQHGDALIELEVMVPKGANSGIYILGAYEIQVLDSFGRQDNPGPGDMGAIYGAAPPKDPNYKKPGEWQKFIIDFRAPRFNDRGRKVTNARFVKVQLNGRTIHENLEMTGPTPGNLLEHFGQEREWSAGPLMFQGDHGPVAFRNIRITPLD